MRKITILLSLSFMAMINCSFAQGIYIKMSDNAGTFVSEVQQNGFVNHLQAYSVSFGLSNTPVLVGGGTVAGKANFSDVAIMKNITQNSPLFNLLAAKGTNITKVEIKYVQGAANPKLRYMVVLENVSVSSVNSSLEGSCESCEVGTESITFFYSKITWIYYDAGGNEKSRRFWDVAANTGG